MTSWWYGKHSLHLTSISVLTAAEHDVSGRVSAHIGSACQMQPAAIGHVKSAQKRGQTCEGQRAPLRAACLASLGTQAPEHISRSKHSQRSQIVSRWQQG